MHPLGVGLLEFETSMHRDILMVGNVYAIDGVLIRFIGHDYGRNERSSPYTKYRWIMMLGYPLDYRALNFIDQAMTSFGKLVSWHNNPRANGFVLVKCLYNGTDYVPRSLIFRQGDRSEASWSCPPPLDDLPPDGPTNSCNRIRETPTGTFCLIRANKQIKGRLTVVMPGHITCSLKPTRKDRTQPQPLQQAAMKIDSLVQALPNSNREWKQKTCNYSM
jgi:hypothetical protein